VFRAPATREREGPTEGQDAATEPLQRKCEKRQGILGAPRFNVSEQLLHRVVVDLNSTFGAVEPSRRDP
jgi:hypothetical protein